DDSKSLAADDLVKLTATITDKDGDHQSAALNIGQNLNFKDDGPSISTIGAEPTLTVDETVLGPDATQNFVANFSSAYGADGAGTITYALSFNAGVTGLVDTLTGEAVVLSLNGLVLEGRTAGTNDLVFTVSVNAAGDVTLDQIRAVVHPDASNPDDSKTLNADNLVVLTATITDKDGDHQSAALNIGTNLIFKDDGPTITHPFDGDPVTPGTQNETLANTAGATASGTFGYDIGADAHPASFYAGGGSDFVDQDLVAPKVQIGLSGTIIGGGGGTLITSNVTLASEDSDFATFDFTFTYHKDPADSTQIGTAGGTLIFDKVGNTYTINLTDPLEGFSFDILHTSEFLSKVPTSNSGHPPIVVEQLQADDPGTTGVNEGFYVQFTANAINKANPFSLTVDGEAKSTDTVFDGTPTHEMVSNNHETWVSATQGTNGVAGDTIQQGELLTLRFFNTNVGIQTEATDPTTVASAVAIKFDGVGTSEDLILILDLKDANGHEITRAITVDNGDLFRMGQVPAPYSSDFTLDNNDALLVVEHNDYNFGSETYQIQGIQIMQSANGLTGSGINLNGGVGGNGGSSLANLQSFTAASFGNEQDVLKITDIGFTSTQTTTPDAHLDFAFQVADADGDTTPTSPLLQHILVDVT
ncbi:DUF5801 domain-containing protein, partial [Mesorhizobium sp. M0051]